MNEPESTPNAEIGLHTSTPLFKFHIEKKIQDDNVARIIECGTNVGLGSTVVFAQTNLPVKTCEVNKKLHKLGKENLKKFKNVKCYNSFTTDRDHCNPVLLEKIETLPTGENWLEKTLKKEMALLNEGESLMIFLDTHWTMGFLEFRAVFDFWYKNKPLKNKIVLVLDDATNLKHRPSIHFLEGMDEEFSILKKERWAIVDFV